MKRVQFDLSGSRPSQPAPAEPQGEQRSVADWARLKGHDSAEFNARRSAERRGLRRGDRHRGPDVEVIRAHMASRGWRPDWRQVGDTYVTEAEYDAATKGAYEVAAASTSHAPANQPAPAALTNPEES